MDIYENSFLLMSTCSLHLPQMYVNTGPNSTPHLRQLELFLQNQHNTQQLFTAFRHLAL